MLAQPSDGFDGINRQVWYRPRAGVAVSVRLLMYMRTAPKPLVTEAYVAEWPYPTRHPPVYCVSFQKLFETREEAIAFRRRAPRA